MCRSPNTSLSPTAGHVNHRQAALLRRSPEHGAEKREATFGRSLLQVIRHDHVHDFGSRSEIVVVIQA